MTADEIILYVTKQCGRLGVAVLLSDKEDAQLNGMDVSGYFDPDAKLLVVSTGTDLQKWMGTLLHEYCHVTQWAEQCPAWVADEDNDIDSWLNGKRVKNIEQMIKNCQEMEADNERRTVKLARQLKAPLDLVPYCRQANSYLHFHNVMLETRKWYAKGKGPYSSPDVWPLFNKNIDTTFKTTKKQWAALMTCV